MNALKSLVLLATAASLTACVSVHRVPGPDGREAMVIKCPREEQCMERAAEECGGPYAMLKAGAQTDVFGVGGQTQGSTTHSLTVQCKDAPPAKAP